MKSHANLTRLSVCTLASLVALSCFAAGRSPLYLAHGYPVTLLHAGSRTDRPPVCNSDESGWDPHLYDQRPTKQGMAGTCYAHAVAAQIFSKYRAEHGVDYYPMPAFLALHYKFTNKEFSDKASSTKEFIKALGEGNTIDFAQRSALAPQVAIPANPRISQFDDSKAISILFYFVKHFLSTSRKQPPEAQTLLRALGRKFPILKNSTDPYVLALQEFYPALFSYLVAHHKENQTAAQLLYDFFLSRPATQSLRPLTSQSKLNVFRNFGAFEDFMADHFLTSPSAAIIQVQGRLLGASAFILPDQSHAVILYGYRCRNGAREFLIRNSWGGLPMQQQIQSGRNLSERNLNGDFWIDSLALETIMIKRIGFQILL